jgi:hypothetical protein
VPTLTTGANNSAIASAVDPHEAGSDLVFCVDTAFRAEGSEAPLTGAFLLMPDPASIKAILEAIRLD